MDLPHVTPEGETGPEPPDQQVTPGLDSQSIDLSDKETSPSTQTTPAARVAPNADADSIDPETPSAVKTPTKSQAPSQPVTGDSEDLGSRVQDSEAQKQKEKERPATTTKQGHAQATLGRFINAGKQRVVNAANSRPFPATLRATLRNSDNSAAAGSKRPELQRLQQLQGDEGKDKDRERSRSSYRKPKPEAARTYPGELVVLTLPSLPPTLPTIDVVAVHDIEETLEDAWAYVPDHDFWTRPAASSSSPGQPLEERVEAANDAPKAVESQQIISKRRNQSFKSGLKVLSNEPIRNRGKLNVTHGSERGGYKLPDIKDWVLSVDLGSLPDGDDAAGSESYDEMVEKEAAAGAGAGAAKLHDFQDFPGPPASVTVETTADVKGKGKATAAAATAGGETDLSADSVETTARLVDKVLPDPIHSAKDLSDWKKQDNEAHTSQLSIYERVSATASAATATATAAAAAASTSAVPAAAISGCNARSPTERARKASDWLTDPTMLPRDLDGARIMAFSYTFPTPQADSSPAESEYETYLQETAEALASGLERRRADNHYSKVPIVLIGTGFGCLIIQKVVSLAAAAAATTITTTTTVAGPPASSAADILGGVNADADADARHLGPPTASILSMLAGVFFLEAPAPLPKFTTQKQEDAKKGENKKTSTTQRPIFPPISHVNSSWVKNLLETRLVDSGELWDKFHAAGTREDLSIVWFYRPMSIRRCRKPRINGVTFVPFETFRDIPSRLTGRFRGPQDANYALVVYWIQGSLLFKAATDRQLESLLEQFVNAGDGKFDLTVTDHQSRCSLHRAAECANDVAVMFLVSAMPRLVTCQDHRGLTPLHMIIMKAVETNPEDEDRTRFRMIIEKLLMAEAEHSDMEDDARDTNKQSAWDYACEDRHKWIRDLRNPRSLLTGAKVAQIEKLEDLVMPVNPTVLEACRKYEATLVQFYIAKDGSRDYLDRQRPNVTGLIYDKSYGAQNLFRRNIRRDEDKRPTCRWIHLPANNEKWVHDLFVQLRRIDKSMSGRSHQGTALFDRHMMAGAHRYKQTLVRGADHDDGYESTSPTLAGRPAFRDRFSDGPRIITSPPDGSEGGDRLKPRRTLLSSSSIAMAEGGGSADNSASALALYMPILGFELHQNRMRLSSAMHSAQLWGQDETTLLLRAYFKDPNRPLHCRRTLDQFTYHMLKDTEKRDNSQVIFKWARKMDKSRRRYEEKPPPNQSSDRDGYPVIMIDQLWLWILEDDETVITSFPNTWDPTQPYNLTQHFLQREAKKNDNRPLIESAMDLANLIIKSSVNFMRRLGPMDISLQDCFQSSINDIAKSQSTQFEKFKSLVRNLNSDQINQKRRTEMFNELFQLTKETHLLALILDIQDELKTIKDVFMQQAEVLKKLYRILEEKAHQQHKKPADREREHECEAESESQRSKTSKAHHDHPNTARAAEEKDKDRDNVRSKPKRIVQFADEQAQQQQRQQQQTKSLDASLNNIALVESNIAAVEEMTRYASKIHTEIKGLLNLKQKQANAWEARFAREGSEQTQRQGNITMVFTCVTIFFLPLSFMSSMFAIQVDTFPRDPKSGEVAWPAQEVMGILFGVSLFVIVLLLGAAFNVDRISAFFNNVVKPTGREDDPKSVKIDTGGYDSSDDLSDSSNPTDNLAMTAQTFMVAPRAGRRQARAHFAPLFGRWRFHEKIPLVRRLWEYREYSGSSAGSSGASNPGSASSEYLAEGVKHDYPVHHTLAVASLFFSVQVVGPLLSYAPNWLRGNANGEGRRAGSGQQDVVDEEDGDDSVYRGGLQPGHMGPQLPPTAVINDGPDGAMTEPGHQQRRGLRWAYQQTTTRLPTRRTAASSVRAAIGSSASESESSGAEVQSGGGTRSGVRARLVESMMGMVRWRRQKEEGSSA